MKRSNIIKIGVASLAVFALAAVATPQIKEVIKILGVGAAIKQFGPQIDRELDKLTGHKDSDSAFTKVVPIITVGLNTRGSIGAAQVKGSKKNVDRVQAVAQPVVRLFGEIEVRGLIPVSSTNITDPGDIKPVEGVGVSGIVDLRL